eukprot:3747556-Rhodomonas_salina.1
MASIASTAALPLALARWTACASHRPVRFGPHPIVSSAAGLIPSSGQLRASLLLLAGQVRAASRHLVSSRPHAMFRVREPKDEQRARAKLALSVSTLSPRTLNPRSGLGLTGVGNVALSWQRFDAWKHGVRGQLQRMLGHTCSGFSVSRSGCYVSRRACKRKMTEIDGTWESGLKRPPRVRASRVSAGSSGSGPSTSSRMRATRGGDRLLLLSQLRRRWARTTAWRWEHETRSQKSRWGVLGDRRPR